MANFTDAEVQAAVEKIVRSTVRHPTGILGERKIETSFSDLQEAAAGVYILYFNAPFYTLLLGVRRLQDLLEIQAQTITSLIDAVAATDRLVPPVKDLTPLANARSALSELEAAVASRGSGFSNIETVPAFRRYASNVTQFLATSGQAVRGPSPAETSDGGFSIVDTPAGARSKIPALARDLRDFHDELIRKATLLSMAMDDFASLNLPQVAASGVIARARAVLDGHFEALSGQDENQRLEGMRGVVLDLLTQRPLVEKYGAALGPSAFRDTEGVATAYSDSTHLATPAALTAELFGPYNIVDSSQFIQFTMDGGAPFEYPLPLGFIAELTGVLVEPFEVTADTDELRIVFGDPNGVLVTTDAPLTIGTRTAAQVTSEINAALGASDLVAERVFSPLKFDSVMTTSSLGGNNARFTILAGSLLGLNIQVGDEVDILSGAGAGETWSVSAVDPAGLFFDASGPAPITVVGLPGVAIQVGPAARALRLRDTAPATSLAQRRLVRLPVRGVPEDLTATTLGFTPGIEARSRPVAASDVATNIASSTSKLSAATAFAATHYEGRARSSSSDAALVVLSKFEASGSITAGLAVVFTSSTAVENVLVGDKVVLRSSSAASDVGKEGLVTAVTSSTISITFSSPITVGTTTIEAGPNVSFGFGAVLNITDGLNRGRYVSRESQGVGTSASFEVLLEQNLPIPKDGDLPLTFNVSFGQEAVLFRSRVQSTSSRVEIDNGAVGSAAEYFFPLASLPASARGTTAYLQFATYPKAAVTGDLVQLFEGQYNVVSRELVIAGLEPSLRILKVSPELESTFSMPFDFDVPNPFGRIRVAQVADFDAFSTRLKEWLARPEQQDAYFRELARLLNPVLANTNPTVAQVNDASNQLKKLLSVLTIAGAEAYGELQTPDVTGDKTLEFALANYSSPAEEPVDTLLGTFRQKGADRAIDLLVEGQFSVFFGLDIDGVSYSGTLMKAMRELAREDLPIRKVDRRNTSGQMLIGTIPEEKDFEFDVSDADSPDTPDIPAGPDVFTPGGSY